MTTTPACEWCHEDRGDVRPRRLPDGERPVLCGACFRDAQEIADRDIEEARP